MNSMYVVHSFINLNIFCCLKYCLICFQHALQWLYEKHPLTLIHNVQYIAQHGYWKDLSWLIKFLLEGTISLTSNKQERKAKRMPRGRFVRRGFHNQPYGNPAGAYYEGGDSEDAVSVDSEDGGGSYPSSRDSGSEGEATDMEDAEEEPADAAGVQEPLEQSPKQEPSPVEGEPSERVKSEKIESTDSPASPKQAASLREIVLGQIAEPKIETGKVKAEKMDSPSEAAAQENGQDRLEEPRIPASQMKCEKVEPTESPAQPEENVADHSMGEPSEQDDLKKAKLEEMIRKRVEGQISRADWRRYLRTLPAGSEREQACAHFQTLMKTIHANHHLESKKKKKETREQRAARLDEMMQQPNFAALYKAVVDAFVDALKRDVENLETNKRLDTTSLAGKWAPTLYGAIDEATGLGKSIARALYVPDQEPDSKKLKLAHKDLPAFNKYRDTLNSLRSSINAPERAMSAKK